MRSRLCKGLREGEVTWSAEWKRLAGQQEGGQALWRAGSELYLGPLTHCQTADVSLSVGALGVTSSLSGCVCLCVNICVRAGRGQTVIHYTPAGFVPSSSVWSQNRSEHTHIHTSALPFTIRHFALLTHRRIPSKIIHKDDTLLLSMKRLGAV